jgi:hypothetical protein
MIRAVILAALAVTLHDAHAASTCSWDQPGRDPYTGSPIAAVLSYTNIPAAARVKLAARVRLPEWVSLGRPDDTPDITRHGIASVRMQYVTDVSDMHFGRGSTCGSVTRQAWAGDHAEPARAYCEGEWCIVVPDVCGNVSWARRELPTTARGAAPAAAREVPEPPALALAAVAALAAWVARKLKNEVR